MSGVHLVIHEVFYRGIAEELFWFIRGSTNAKELQDKVGAVQCTSRHQCSAVHFILYCTVRCTVEEKFILLIKIFSIYG